MGVIAVGDRFPERLLPTLDGGTLRLSEAWHAGTALFALGHGECSTTRLALPFVERIHRARDPAATVVAVLQDAAGEAGALVSELGLSLPVALDEEPYALGTELGLEAVPTLVVVDAHGRVRAVVEGFDRDAFESLAARLGVTGGLFTREDEVPAFRPG